MAACRNKYRTADIHDVMEIVRNNECDFNPEPTTIPAVVIFLVINIQLFTKTAEKYPDYVALITKDDVEYTYKQYFDEATRY